MSRNQYTAAQFIAAIPGTGGIVTKISERIGCTWHTARKYIDEYPTVMQAYQDERERVLDMAESALIAQVGKQEAWAVKFILTTIGKDRGYTERTEVTGRDGEAMQVKIIEGPRDVR